jgi:CheY-like chemotaxis protein
MFLLPGAYISVAVSDTGHGMDEKTKACIFEPFFTTKESGKGTGLGLAMVYGTVKHSGGYVMVHTAPGQGTEFEILLPRVEGRPTVRVKQPVATGGGTETLLLVEDQEELRRLLSTVLRRNGYTVLDATNGSAALEAFDQDRERISLVITDIVMPILGGADLGAMLREKSPDLKLLYMSGYTDSLLPRQGGLPAGAAFLQKPFTPDVLARKVRDILDSRGQASGHTNGHA